MRNYGSWHKYRLKNNTLSSCAAIAAKAEFPMDTFLIVIACLMAGCTLGVVAMCLAVMAKDVSVDEREFVQQHRPLTIR